MTAILTTESNSNSDSDTAAARAPWPTERANRDTILAQFGEGRADLLQWAMTTGDPLADAVVDEMHELGMKVARPLFMQGVREGLASLEDPPPALAALLTQTETLPSYVDDELFDELPLAYFTSPVAVHLISLSAGALVRVYASPSIAEVLTSSGRLIDGAGRRIQETGKWLALVMLPGSLRVGQPGYIATLEVRMLHAHMRRLAVSRGYDPSAHGAPINQVDLGRTWMDFTLTAYQAESDLGYGMTARETAGLYRYWWYVGHLLGIDARLIEGITDHRAAERVDEAFQAVTGPLIDDSAVLADATLGSIASIAQDLFRVPARLSRPVLNAITRRIHGAAMSHDLGIPSEPLADAWLTPVVAGLRKDRERRRRNPERWAAEMAKNIAEVNELFVVDDAPTAFERGAVAADD